MTGSKAGAMQRIASANGRGALASYLVRDSRDARRLGIRSCTCYVWYLGMRM